MYTVLGTDLEFSNLFCNQNSGPNYDVVFDSCIFYFMYGRPQKYIAIVDHSTTFFSSYKLNIYKKWRYTILETFFSYIFYVRIDLLQLSLP